MAAPETWNTLPVNIRTAQSTEDFKSVLKTHLLALAFNTGCLLTYVPNYCAFILFFNVLLFMICYSYTVF